jgi:hypothetical protein
VPPYNDFPGVSGTLPAFSKRACDALMDLLKPNGELLPLEYERGEYFFYNVTTVIDALDISKSKCRFWCDPPTTAAGISYFAFHEEKLARAPIFRIIEKPIYTLVTNEFVDRVSECGLNGFEFNKIWPLPKGTDWRIYNRKKKNAKPKISPSKHTLLVILELSGQKPSAAEKKAIARIEDDLDAQLEMRSLNARYFGRYEGSDTVEDQFRIFICCPDVDALVNKLKPWLENLDWSGQTRVIKRYGEMRNSSAKEVEFVAR